MAVGVIRWMEGVTVMKNKRPSTGQRLSYSLVTTTEVLVLPCFVQYMTNAPVFYRFSILYSLLQIYALSDSHSAIREKMKTHEERGEITAHSNQSSSLKRVWSRSIHDSAQCPGSDSAFSRDTDTARRNAQDETVAQILHTSARLI